MACVAVFTRHPKFAALTVCEFKPDHVDEQRLLVGQFVEGLAAAFPRASAPLPPEGSRQLEARQRLSNGRRQVRGATRSRMASGPHVPGS